MTLLTDLQKLREMEQKAIGGTWSWEGWHDGPLLYSTEYMGGNEDFNPQPGVEMDLLMALRNAAPAMLSVLECFKEGDAMRLQKQLDYLESQTPEPNAWHDSIVDMVARLQKAASLMEGEE